MKRKGAHLWRWYLWKILYLENCSATWVSTLWINSSFSTDQNRKTDEKRESLDRSWTSGLGNCERVNLCCLKPLVCGALSQQPQEATTAWIKLFFPCNLNRRASACKEHTRSGTPSPGPMLLPQKGRRVEEPRGLGAGRHRASEAGGSGLSLAAPGGRQGLVI